MKHTIRPNVLVLVTMITLMLSMQSNAVILSPPETGFISFNSGSWARTLLFASADGETIHDGTNTLSDEDQAGHIENSFYAASREYNTNLMEGSIELSASSSRNSPSEFTNLEVIASIYDTVSFDFDGVNEANVGFSFSFDSILSNADTTKAFAGGSTIVTISDLTAPDSGLFIVGLGTEPDLGSRLINRVEVSLARTSYGLISSDRENGNVNHEVNTNGENVHIERTVSDSFTAIEGHLYAVLVQSSVGIQGDSATVDLTSTFAFTGLSGGTFVSASGKLPGSSGTLTLPVSIVSSHLLALVGFLMLILSRRINR